MKKPNTPSKLVLKRETVRSMTPTELKQVAGGQRPVETPTYILSGHPAWCCA